MTVAASKYALKPNDLYETEPWATQAVCRVSRQLGLAQNGRTVWEPAAGNHNSVGEAVVAYYVDEKCGGRRFVSMLREHEIKGFPKLVDSAVIIRPLAFDLDIKFIHPPKGLLH